MYVYGKNLHVLVRFVFLFMYESYGIFIKCQGYFYEIFCEISISSRIVILLGGCREIYQIPLGTLCEERYRVGLYWSVFRHQDRDDEVIILKITMTTLMTITMTMAMVMVMAMMMDVTKVTLIWREGKTQAGSQGTTGFEGVVLCSLARSASSILTPFISASPSSSTQHHQHNH